MIQDAQSVLSFWFNELTPEQWFKKDTSMDQQITQRFGSLLTKRPPVSVFNCAVPPKGSLPKLLCWTSFLAISTVTTRKPLPVTR